MVNQIKRNELEELAEAVGRDLGIDLTVCVNQYTVDLYTGKGLGNLRTICIFETRKEARRALLAMSGIALQKMIIEREA